MSCYLISYDLVKERNYDDLYDKIKSYGTYAKICESTWAVVTTKTAEQVRDHINEILDSDDRIFVVKSGVEAAWKNVLCSNEWLKKNL